MSVGTKSKVKRDVAPESESDSSELPEGWATASLPSIVYFQEGPGLLKKQFGESGVPFLNIRTFEAGHINRAKCQFLKQDEFDGKYEQFLLDEGDLVVSSSGTIGKLAIIRADDLPLMLNTSTIRFRAMDKQVLDQGFLKIYLQSNHFIQQLDSAKTGSAILNYGPTHLRRMQMLVPPLAEQRRIVAKLELLLGKVTSCQQRLARIPLLLKRFRQSVLAAACSGKLTADWREENVDVETAHELLERLRMERRKTWSIAHTNRKYQEADSLEDDDLEAIPDSWLWTNFDHCAAEITVGHVGPMKDRYVDSGVAFLRSQNVRPLRFDPMGLVRIPKDFQAELTKSRLVGGEILVVRSGANTGDCCVFPRGMDEANCADLVITRPLSGLCAEYGAMYVASPFGQAAIGLRQTGIAQPHFNIRSNASKTVPTSATCRAARNRAAGGKAVRARGPN